MSLKLIQKCVSLLLCSSKSFKAATLLLSFHWLIMAKSLTGNIHKEAAPKRTRIGNGRRIRSRVFSGRTKRASARKAYRGQGK